MTQTKAAGRDTATDDTGVAGLHASTPGSLSFAPSLSIRAFVLEREAGDVLMYSVPGVEADGVVRHYLNHWHEAAFGAGRVTAPLFVHEAEREHVPEHHPVRGTFSRRHHLDDDFEVIPTPGHTRGATAYLWDTGRHRLLFTGDTIYLDDGEWVAAVLDSSDRAAYLDSLDLMRDLDFDVLVPWAATSGQPPVSFTSPAETRRRIDAIRERIRNGGQR